MGTLGRGQVLKGAHMYFWACMGTFVYARVLSGMQDILMRHDDNDDDDDDDNDDNDNCNDDGDDYGADDGNDNGDEDK